VSSSCGSEEKHQSTEKQQFSLVRVLFEHLGSPTLNLLVLGHLAGIKDTFDYTACSLGASYLKDA
jgi:hypothetical protein